MEVDEFHHQCSTCLYKYVITDSNDIMSLFTTILKDNSEETS